MMNRFFTLLFAACCLTAVGQVPEYVPTYGLVAWYELDGNGLDESPAHLDINSDSNPPAADRFGQGGAALRFENDPIFSSHPQLNLTAKDTFTVSLWLQIDDVSPSFALIGNNSGSGEENKGQLMYGWGAGSENSAWHVNSPEAPGFGNFSNQVDLEPDTWIHLVYIKSGNDFQFYKDGMPYGFGQYEYAQPYSDDPTWIGGGNDCCNLGLIGELDDLGIWDRELTQEEVTELFNATPPSDNLALEFSGIGNYLGPNAGFLEVPFADALDRTGEESFTIASDVLFAADDFPYALYHTGQDGDPENSIRFNIATSELEFMWENNGDNYKLECALSTTSVGTLATGVWHNIAATWDGVTLILFVNGIEVASDSPMNGGPGETEDRPFYWGSHLGGNELNGQLDNAQFWNIGLTEEDIQSYLDCPPTGSELGLEAYWTFDGPEVNLILDITGNGHHGFAQGVQKVHSTRPECPLISGCTNAEACNYEPTATEDDGNCIFPVVGQDCQAGEFLCGEGTVWDSQTQMCLPEVECDSVYNPDVDLDNFIGLTDILALLSYYNASWPPWQCGDPLEYQGYDYETVQIGEQCWFAENLRAENYRNGDLIPNDLNNNQWVEATEGALSVYGDEALNVSLYGRLYNWYAATDDRALCPSGWHVPADSEWTALTNGLGGDSIAGEKIKSIDGWNGTNSSGFSGLPGGNRRDSDGNFYFIEHNAFWWSTTTVNDKSVDRSLGNHTAVIRSESSQQYGHSIRCIKDSE